MRVAGGHHTACYLSISLRDCVAHTMSNGLAASCSSNDAVNNDVLLCYGCTKKNCVWIDDDTSSNTFDPRRRIFELMIHQRGLGGSLIQQHIVLYINNYWQTEKSRTSKSTQWKKGKPVMVGNKRMENKSTFALSNQTPTSVFLARQSPQYPILVRRQNASHLPSTPYLSFQQPSRPKLRKHTMWIYVSFSFNS